MTNPPDITTPLVRGPHTQPANENMLGALSKLVGNWNSPTGTEATGFNVMPLPQDGAPNGYITKNFPYYEELTVAPIAGNAPNRGGDYTQTANTLFYEQRVYFSDVPPTAPAPTKDSLVHAENGSFLHLTTGPQIAGAYGPGTVTPPAGGIPDQNQAIAYVKQVSVPHGNSILATGGAKPISKIPAYPPSDRSVKPFTDPAIKDPNAVLEPALKAILTARNATISGGWEITYSTKNPGGNVSDIVFEQRHATVTGFDSIWYIIDLSDGSTVVQYTQTMWMNLLINGSLQPFSHVDANTLVSA